jgi:cold shock protein
MRGVVIAFDALDGTGLIQAVRGGDRYFVHRTAIKGADVTALQEGQKVDFEVLSARHGKQAVDVVPVRLFNDAG